MKYYRIKIDEQHYIAYRKSSGFILTSFWFASIFSSDSLSDNDLVNYLHNYQYKLIETNQSSDLLGPFKFHRVV